MISTLLENGQYHSGVTNSLPSDDTGSRVNALNWRSTSINFWQSSFESSPSNSDSETFKLTVALIHDNRRGSKITTSPCHRDINISALLSKLHSLPRISLSNLTMNQKDRMTTSAVSNNLLLVSQRNDTDLTTNMLCCFQRSAEIHRNSELSTIPSRNTIHLHRLISKVPTF